MFAPLLSMFDSPSPYNPPVKDESKSQEELKRSNTFQERSKREWMVIQAGSTTL